MNQANELTWTFFKEFTATIRTKCLGWKIPQPKKKSEARLLQVSEKEKTASSHQPAQAIHTGIYSLTTCLHMSA